MSDADSFIREVSDEVRRDRMFRLWRRWGPVAIGALVAAVGVSAVMAWMESRAEAAAREAGGVILAAARGEEPPEGLLAAAETLDAGPAALARLQAAAATAAAGDAAGAVTLYDQVAGNSGAPQAVAEFAALRAALLRAETGDREAALDALDGLARADSVWRTLALESQATLKLDADDLAGARADLEAVLADQTATAATRERAQALLNAIGGEAAE